MSRQTWTRSPGWIRAAWIATSMVGYLAALGSCQSATEERRLAPRVPASAASISASPSGSASSDVVARAATIPTYPCRQCHDLRRTDPVRRELKEYHTTIKLNHGPALIWCDSCHRFSDFNVLHLADDTPVAFDEAYRVCGQCHGEKYRDWVAGTHGLHTGKWSGASPKRSCVACHSPHDPRFAALAPLPAPELPRGFTGVLAPHAAQRTAPGANRESTRQHDVP